MKLENLNLRLEPKGEIPIYVQLKNQLRYKIHHGELAPGEQLPTLRELASHLSIDGNTVSRVYRELEDEGLIERQQGRGTFVSHKERPAPDEARRKDAEAAVDGVVRLLLGMNLTPAEVAGILREFAERLHKE
jgi:GntR family transcriptional regulator